MKTEGVAASVFAVLLGLAVAVPLLKLIYRALAWYWNLLPF